MAKEPKKPVEEAIKAELLDDLPMEDFQFLLQQLLDAWRPILQEDLELSKSAARLMKETGQHPHTCEDEQLLNFAYPPRDRFAGSACHDCSDLAECQSKAGYCFRDTYFNYGTSFGPPPSCPRTPDDGMHME